MNILGRLIAMLLLLVVEVILTMATYAALDLYARSAFGVLVGLSGSVLTAMRSLLALFLPTLVPSADSSLFGDLAPKAVLLMLLGLVVAAILRALVELMGFGHRRT